MFARQRHRDAGTERFAPHYYSLGGVAIRAERMPRGGVEQKSRLARRSSRAAETAVGYGNDAEPALHKPGEAVYAVAQRSAVPLKIENDWPIGPRRNVPGDQPLTVCRRERYLPGLRQAGGGGRDAGEIGHIHQRPLGEIHHPHDPAVGDDHANSELEGTVTVTLAWYGRTV